MTGETILTRVKDIHIGLDSGNYTTWTGIRTVKYIDTDPWIHMKVPYGKIIHQEIGSPHIEGEIHCQDLTSLIEALYETVIDAYNHYAIDNTNIATLGSRKWKVDYLIMEFAEQNNVIITATFTDFRIATVEVGNIEAGKEAMFIVKFTADEVTYS